MLLARDHHHRASTGGASGSWGIALLRCRVDIEAPVHG